MLGTVVLGGVVDESPNVNTAFAARTPAVVPVSDPPVIVISIVDDDDALFNAYPDVAVIVPPFILIVLVDAAEATYIVEE